MPLLVEDGSIVAGANSFVTIAELDTYLANRGDTSLSTKTDQEKEVLLYKAIEYLLNVESKFKGVRVSSEQVLMFPRSGVTLFGFTVESDIIPDQIKNAQMQLASELNAQNLLANTTPDKRIIKEKLGPIETEYSEHGFQEGSTIPVLVNTFLQPLFNSSGQSISLIRS